MSVVDDARARCRPQIALYNGGRLVYGIGAHDVMRVRHDAIAITAGTPGAGGVLSAPGNDRTRRFAVAS
jgi:hypothetical protein